MSRTTRTNITNPVSLWMEWNKGEVTYYDKEAKARISCKLPFEFILLDQLSTITGWSDLHQSRLVANEVRSTRKEELTVRALSNGKDLVTGLYGAIKSDVVAMGGKYAKSLYILARVGDDDDLTDWELCNLTLSGAACGAFMDFSDAVGKQSSKTNGADPALWGDVLRIHGTVSGKKGSVVFETPAFDTVAMYGDDLSEAADAMDNTLQEYLSAAGKAREEGGE